MSVRMVRFGPARGAFYRAMLVSPTAAAAVRARGEAVRAAAARLYGAKSYGLKVRRGRKRVRAIVYTADRYAIRSNFAHNTLAKAVSQAGGRD